MKNLITSNIVAGAKYPFKKESIEFLYLSNKELLNALAQSIGGEFDGTSAYILYGMQKVDLGGGLFSFSKGAVYDSATDEVYLFDEEASIAIATAPVLTITTTFPAGYNPVEFTNTTNYNVHQEKKLVVSDGALGSADLNYEDLIVVQPEVADTWHEVGGVGEPIFENGFDSQVGTRPAAFRLLGGYVELKGNLDYGLASTSFAAFTLPLGYRPDYDLWLPMADINSSSDVSLRVLTSGAVIVGFTGTASFGYLDGIRFSLT